MARRPRWWQWRTRRFRSAPRQQAFAELTSECGHAEGRLYRETGSITRLRPAPMAQAVVVHLSLRPRNSEAADPVGEAIVAT